MFFCRGEEMGASDGAAGIQAQVLAWAPGWNADVALA
jgi:hypothetical protein